MIYVEHFSILIPASHSHSTLDYLRCSFNKRYPQRNKSNKYFLIPYYVKPLPVIIRGLFHKIYMAISNSL